MSELLIVPAFPCPESDVNYFQAGMTLLDYFAGQALAMIPPDLPRGAIASQAYSVAIVMLLERADAHARATRALEAQHGK